MVFESVIADILNIYIGDYVENLDRSQLQIGIWGGDVVLQDLVLKPNILDELNLPLKCTFGHLGRLVLKIPWKNLYSAPVIATVERLFLLAVPDNDCHKDTTQQTKQAELQRLEVARCLKKEADKAKTGDTFVEKLATQIIKNIQIKIQDIHIRYEDASTNPKCPFSVGVTLHNLSVQSTDKNWREGMVQDKSSMIYKVLNLEGLAVYWNCQSSQFSLSESRADMLNLFQNAIFCNGKHPERFEYMLGPITSAARLQLNPKPESDDTPFQIPKVLLTVLMDTLAVGISKEQYHSLVELLDVFDFSNKISEYQKYRPSVPRKKGFYKEWWKFAKNCILSRRWRGVNWERLKRHCTVCRDYASVYMRKLQIVGAVPTELEDDVARCESELDVFNIIRIRRQVEAEVEWLNQKTPKKNESSGISSWLSSWWRGSNTQENNELTDKFKHELTAEERLKLYQAIDYAENADPAHYPEDFVERQVIFQLGKLIVDLRDSKSRVLLAKLSGVFTSLEQRPSASAFRVTLKMSELGVWGVGDEDVSPQLVKSVTYLEDGSETVLMRLLLETNPLDKSCGRRLHINAAPLQLIYDARTTRQLAAIFQGPQSDVLVQLQAAAGAQLSEMSALGLQYAIEHHVMTDIEVDLKSSYVLIPYGGCYTGIEDLLVINLGQLSVMTLPRDLASNPRLLYQQGLSTETIVATMREESYDRFCVELKNVQVLLALSGEDWESVLHSQKSSFMHLLEPISFSCQVEKCLIQNDPSLPNLKIVGKLSTASFIVEDNRFIHLMLLYNSIPFSEENENSEVLSTGMHSAHSVHNILENSDSVSPSSSDTLVDSVKLDLKFDMEGVTATLYKTSDSNNTSLQKAGLKKMLELRVLHLGLSVLQRSCDMSITARLGGVTLIYSGREGTLMLLDPSGHSAGKSNGTDMLTIKYTTVDKREDVKSNEEWIQQYLEADFIHLTVLLHHEILLALLDYGQTVSQRLKSLTASSHVSRIARQKAVKTPALKAQRKINKKTDSKLKFSARLHAFNVSLIQQQQALAHFMVEGMQVNAISGRMSTTISARLRNVCLLDPNPKTSHNKIISILGREALSLEVVMFHQSKKLNKNSTSMSIKAHLTRSRIVFLNSFMQSVMGFLNSFQKAQENIAQVVADAAEAAKQKVIHAHAESQFVVLDMSFQAPLILVPVSAISREVLQLDFGQLLIKNKLEVNSTGPVDVIRLDLQHLEVARVALSSESNVISERKLVLPVTFTLLLTRSLTPSHDGSVPEIIMRGHLNTLEASVNQNDVQMIMRILAENVDGASSKSSAEPKISVNQEETVSTQKESTLSWQFALTMSTLKLQLGLNQNNQINFAMTGSEFAILKKKDMQVTFRIKDLIATNPFATSMYQKVVAVEGTEALSIGVVLHDRNIRHNGNDMTVKASMARIRVIYLPSLISALKEFLLAFNYKPEGIVEAMAGVAEAAKEEVIEAHNQATRIGLDVDLKAPVIILPHHGMGSDVLLLDFGNLTIKNKFQTVSAKGTQDEDLIDNLILGLQNLKISRVELGPSGEIVNECWLLQPINLFMEMKRNLSSKKIKTVFDLELKGHLKSVVVALSQEDIKIVMGVLSSFSDSGSQETVPSAVTIQEDTLSVTDMNPTSMSVNFSFTMERLVVELFDEQPKLLDFLDFTSPTHSAENSLGRWSLVLLIIDGKTSVDGSLYVEFHLADCQLDDSRKERQTGLIRLLESKPEQTISCTSTEPKTRNMKILYYKKGSVTKVKIHVYSFNLVLSLEYLRQLGNFLTKAFEQPGPVAPKGHDIRAAVSQQFNTIASSPSVHQHSETKFTLVVHAENPDVFLVEDMGDPKTTSLVLRSDIKCSISQTPSVTDVEGTIKELQVYSCCYHPDLRKSTMSQILQPCSMQVKGTTTHFEVQISNIRLRVSPGTLNLLNRVMTAVYTREEQAGEVQNIDVNYLDIWTPKLLSNSNHWYLKTEIGDDALQMNSKTSSQPKTVSQKKKEICILKMPSLTVTVEAGAGAYTLPMIMLTAGINAMALDWSSKLLVEASVSLQMAYYNSRLALWEPLVEPVEVTHNGRSSHRPWELMTKVKIDNSSETDSGAENVDQPLMSILVDSKDSLELTITKTCLEVLTGLSQAFQLVGDEVQREGPPAPYHVINHTGVVLSLLLDVGNFKECRQWNEGGPSRRALLPGESVPLKAEDQLNLSSPLSLIAQGQAQEKYLRILIDDLGETLDLPIVQAGQRHFPLHQDWGLISDVCVESGSTIVTLRSTLQIYNNLGMPIDVHYQPDINAELKYVNTVPSGEHIDLPFDALYTPMRELHISVPGYKKVTYAWAQEFSLASSVLHECKSIQRSSKESVFLRILRVKHQAYSKTFNTQGKNSVFYKMYVQPAVKIKNLLPVGITIAQPEISVIHVLAPGERLNIATARPDGSKLLVQMPDYRQEVWQCWFPLSACDKEFSVLTFKNQKGKVLSIGSHTVYKRGVFIATLYSPYWMLNKTGLPLSYKLSDGSAIVNHNSGDAKTAVMFPSFSDNMKASIQVADGNWSQCFSLDIPGSTGIVTCPALGQLYRLGVSVQLMRCTLTKQVTITPHFVLINTCQHAVECQEANRPADLWVKVEPGDCCSMWPVNPDKPVKLRARMSGTRHISVPFSCSAAHTTLLRLDNQWGGLNVDVQLTESSVYITFAGYEAGQAAALLVNRSDIVIPFSEKGSNTINMLNPGTEQLFSWMEPDGPREIDFILHSECPIEKEVCQLRRDAAGSLMVQSGQKVFWSSFLDGSQRVIVFSREPTDTQTGQGIRKGRIQRSLTINLSGLGLSIVDNEEKIEVLYVAVSRMPHKLQARYNKSPGAKEKKVGLWVQMTWLLHEIQVHAKLDHLQADCQLPECTYPVALAPVPPPRSVAAGNVARPFMEFSAVIRKAKHSSLQQVQYCKALVQAFHIKVDMGLMSALAALVEAGELSDEVEVAQFLEDFLLVKALLPAHVALGAARGQKHYFCLFHLSPLKIHLSLSLSGDAGVRKGREPPHALRVLLHSLGVTLTNAQDVVFRLAYFERREILLSAQQLLTQASDHYRSQVLKQLYVLVLGLDVLGNPLNFVKGLKQGVEDMFYEPIQGAIQGPEEFAQGLALGVRSLFGHTVGGAFGAASRITGAMGSGVAALTFDEEYQRKRQETISNRSGNVTKGLAQSGEGLVKGVVDGVSGVFLKPISGAKKEGVEGFFKGFGKGMAGLVARPTAGIIDFASGSFDALRRTTETTVDVERQRPPRFFRQDGRVRPYVLVEAEGHKILQELENTDLAASDIYDCHVNVESSGQSILMLTNKRVMLISRNEFFETWKLEWQIPWETLQAPVALKDGIYLPVLARHSKTSGKGYKVAIHDPDIIQWIIEKMKVLTRS